MDYLPLIYGAVVGISLGLTGGGGSIFAVPLLIYGLGAGVREAVGISLAAVGATALFGAVMRMRSGNVELTTSLLFALAGMAGAPLGTMLGNRLPDTLTLSLFAVLMVFSGFRMWSKRPIGSGSSGLCQRDDGNLRLRPKCFLVLMLAGLLVGVLSGIFGVGGGFIIVPALMLVSGMPIHKAVASSLLVIALICVSGVASYLISGDGLPAQLTLLFLAGGFLGMFAGTLVSRRISGPALRRVFAFSMWFVALFVLAQNHLTAENSEGVVGEDDPPAEAIVAGSAKQKK